MEVCMKIFAIVVYRSARNSFSASLDSNFLGILTDPFEKLIRDTLEENNGMYVDFLRENTGTHSLSMTGAASYARCIGEKIVVVAVDEAMNHIQLHKLMDNIDVATTSRDLKNIINNPEQSVKDKYDMKMDAVRDDIEETKQQMMINIDKIIERGEKIENLKEKTEALEKQAILFRKSTTKLKESMRCPGMWSLFTPVANLASWVFRENEVKYEYEAEEPEGRKNRRVIN